MILIAPARADDLAGGDAALEPRDANLCGRKNTISKHRANAR
jgi:hypothetical protein